MSRGIVEKLARFFHDRFALDHDKEWSEWPGGGCQTCISAAHEFLPILSAETKQSRAEVLAALNCQKCGNKAEMLIVRYESDVKPCCTVYVDLADFQPAAADLEELLDKAHEAALPHAADQLLKAITEGGEFAVGSPLAKVKERVEALLREADLKSLYWCRRNLDTYDHGKGVPYAAVELRHKLDRRIAELEKARALLEEIKL